MPYCVSCGTKAGDSDQFCRNCGGRITHNADSPTESHDSGVLENDGKTYRPVASGEYDSPKETKDSNLVSKATSIKTTKYIDYQDKYVPINYGLFYSAYIISMPSLIVAYFIPIYAFFIPIYALIGLAGVTVYVIIWLKVFHRCWKSIPKHYRRTTPDKAVGYLFIPLFNYYWSFQALRGLSLDSSRYMAEKMDTKGEAIDENIATAYCVLIIANIVPGLNFITLLVTIALYPMILHQMDNYLKLVNKIACEVS